KFAGAAISKGIFQVVFDIENRSPELMAFNKNFLAAYDMAPARDALIAYDSIRLLVHTIEATGSIEAQTLANSLRALRYAGPYMGLSGPISFDRKGRRLDMTINTGHVPMSRLADREEVKTFLGRRKNPAAAIDILQIHRDGNRSLEEMRAMPTPVCRQHQT
ncbi:MAG: ABC transporter substrate-binding protein, partial [Flavobacteriales bacterium]